MNSKDIRDRHAQYLFPAVANFYAEPVVIDKASGCTVTDADGKEYLDWFGGILTVSVGHCHPEITEKVAAQARKLVHTSTLYPTGPMVDLAERLAGDTPGKLQKSFFTSSGTEADETAMMLARLHTGNNDIIALRHAYAGRSLLNTNITAHAPWRPLPSLVPGIKHAHNAYCYRCAFGHTYPSCEMRCATDMKELIQTETNGQVACLIAEPVQGVGGFIVPPPEYFKIVVEIVREHGGVFICDEVQTGFGRTGGKMWGIEHWGVEPEIMTMAKGAANGYPVGITIAEAEVADSFKAGTIATFGGNPVSATATMATMDVMRDEDIPGRAERLGKRLRDGLDALAEQHDIIGDVRGMGLMLAMELVKDRGTKEPDAEGTVRLMEETRERGLLIGKGGLYGNILRIAPPMLITEDAVDEGLKQLGAALQAL